MIDTQLLVLLLTPLIGGVLLALFGSRHWAAELNSLMSFCTFIASVMLTVRVIMSALIRRATSVSIFSSFTTNNWASPGMVFICSAVKGREI